ncbi:class I SAM-dependent methyltransferase [Arthrobacter agilis]|uniref:class I SAM-dependent methyltransferase n=1 Tax=Arthrobacter agilis TaxID=37921 RepID=UPI002365A33F|nr:class I SAM-dependent methyltransferase [Arthrobacter agilis]WDF32370.1 class I SAM-dependent methyltransferase [Arthrobacter agilis]
MRTGPRLDDDRRRELAGAYLSGAGRYDRVRPGYPEAIADWLVPAHAREAVDVGAGTGLFTRALVDRGLDVTAVDPSEDMLAVLSTRLPSIPTVLGTAEETHLPAASADLLTLAQTWHWCDHAATVREAARVLRPGGTLALVWNQLDVAVPWVHRLSRIMHAGDVFSPDDRPDVGRLFGTPEDLLVRWTQELTLADVIDLARSRSYYRRATPALQSRVEANLDWYLTEYLAFPAGAILRLPYYTHAWRATALQP